MKRVFRDSFNGILGGVCSGLGEYFEIDPVIFRLLFIAFFFLFGGGIFIVVLGI